MLRRKQPAESAVLSSRFEAESNNANQARIKHLNAYASEASTADMNARELTENIKLFNAQDGVAPKTNIEKEGDILYGTTPRKKDGDDLDNLVYPAEAGTNKYFTEKGKMEDGYGQQKEKEKVHDSVVKAYIPSMIGSMRPPRNNYSVPEEESTKSSHKQNTSLLSQARPNMPVAKNEAVTKFELPLTASKPENESSSLT